MYHGSKRVQEREVFGIDNKCQITATFAASLTGSFLLIQLLYEGKTTRYHAAVDFPEGWHITHTPNRWSNKQTMITYIQSIIVPYMTEKRSWMSSILA